MDLGHLKIFVGMAIISFFAIAFGMNLIFNSPGIGLVTYGVQLLTAIVLSLVIYFKKQDTGKRR